MAEAYFEKHLTSQKCKKSLSDQILVYLNQSIQKVFTKLASKSKPIPAKQNLQELIEKHLTKLNPADVELNLRRARLREAKRFKEELEAKLGHITESIGTLNSMDEFPAKPKVNLLDSQARHEYFEEEKAKVQTLQQKAKEYHKQQNKRQKKIKVHIEELEKEIQREKALKKEQQELRRIEKDKEYKENLQKMHEKKIQREKELEGLKAQDKVLNKIKKNKPLYVKLSEQYLTQVEMPELQKRKEDISKKRIVNSISSTQIMAHAKLYETTKQEHMEKFKNELKTKFINRKAQSTDNTFTVWKQKAIIEEKHAKEEQKKLLEEKMKLLDKRSTYASFVKQTYLPSIDTSKREEIEKRKLHLVASSKVIKPVSQEPLGKDSISLSKENASEANLWKPHKFKENSLAPKPMEKKVAKSIDYLAELRKIREETDKEQKEGGQDEEIVQFEWDESLQNLPEAQKMKIIQKQSKKIEKALRKKELAMANTKEPSQTLKYSDDINELLINSIKTKISILEKSS